EVEIIPAQQVAAAARTEDILGRKSGPSDKQTEPANLEKNTGRSAEALAEPAAAAPLESGATTDSAPAPKPKPAGRKRPLSVASAPLIGNYQLPHLDFLQHPDTTLKPTESKEELMANARLMQQTLAQFDIEVSLGDITKGPTITRYELHPAPGVKLEKITALNNNIAAALKAERIHILAPVPGKSS